MKRLLTALVLSPALVLVPLAHAADPAPAKTEKPAASQAKPAVVGKSGAAGAPDSLAMLEKAVARDSSKFDNLYRLGVMYLDRDKVPEATKVLQKAH